MQRSHARPPVRPRRPALLLPALLLLVVLVMGETGCATRYDARGPAAPGIARGVVFLDRDRDGQRDSTERGIRGVRVSNGRDVVRTDFRGRYEIPAQAGTIVFVVKPTGMMTPVDEHQLPRFYATSNTANTANAANTGNAPEARPGSPASFDFPLVRQKERSPFRVLIVGDPQPANPGQLRFFKRDILEELPGHGAAFGISLGDLVGDDLSLLGPLTRAMSLVGIPWYNVLGNHDLDLDAADDAGSDATFERFFGPSTYAFEYARVHFVVLDDVFFHPPSPADDRGPSYDGWLTDEQLEFVANYLADVPKDERIVVVMHIPLVGRDGHQVPQRDRLFAILQRHPNTLSISAHNHIQRHYFLGPEAGNPGPIHHHWNSGTASGSWWMGDRDELGIPHTTMRDGAPNGYSILTLDAADYSIRFKAARRPADYQMNIFSADPIRAASSEPSVVRVNVFAGSERSKVEMRLVPPSGRAPADRGEDPGARIFRTGWTELELSDEVDPAYRLSRSRELARPDADDRPTLPGPARSSHLWRGELPAGLAAGSYWIEARETDMFGQVHLGRRAIQVE